MHKRYAQQPIIQPTALPPLERKTYTIEEVAMVLGLGRNTVLNLIRDRRLRTVPDIGKRVLIPCVAIDEFLSE
jgi:excisionase family DNA binding protein